MRASVLKSWLWVIACASLAGALPSEQILLNVPFFSDHTDQCGPATLAAILNFWGKDIAPGDLKKEIYQNKLHGTLPMDMSIAAEAHGLKTTMVRGDLNVLQSELRARSSLDSKVD